MSNLKQTILGRKIEDKIRRSRTKGHCRDLDSANGKCSGDDYTGADHWTGQSRGTAGQ